MQDRLVGAWAPSAQTIHPVCNGKTHTVQWPVRSEIACLVLTNQVTQEAVPWLNKAREIFGRLIIFIDRARAFPEAENRAKEVASEVHFSDSTAFFSSNFAGMIETCQSDWVVFLDHDEELSPEWAGQEWLSVLRAGDFTHFFSPRRWIVPNGNYIAAEPWWPDLQMRLFRSEAATRYPTKPHEPVTVAGPAALLKNLSFHHHIWLSDQDTREKKVAFYDNLLPGGALEYFYLHEQFRPREMPLPSPARFDPIRDVITMSRLDPLQAARFKLSGQAMPERIAAGQLFWARALVHNQSDSVVSSAPSFLVRLSYHWRDAATGAMEIFDGLRTNIMDPMVPGEIREIEIVVRAPPRRGRFLLELSLVQEQCFWFDDLIAEAARTFAIEVI